MSKASRPVQRPIEEVAAARTFYAGIGQDVGYFSALWHTFSVGHLLTNDLDRIYNRSASEKTKSGEH